MGSLLAGMARQVAGIAHQLTSQIVVSVTTAICVALISNAYLQRDDRSPPPAASPAPVRAESEAQATTVLAKKVALPRPVKTTEASVPERLGADAKVDKALNPLPKLEAVYIPTIPPAATPVVAMRPPAQAWPQPAQPFLQPADAMPAATEEPKRVRLLGIPLPGVRAARDGIASLFDDR